MPTQMRQALTDFTNKVFLPQTDDSSTYKKFDRLPDNQLVTSLPLQMTVYFNIFFFPFWLTAVALMLSLKYVYLDGTYQVLLIAILVVFSAVEIIRLYLGFVGNLQEKVPELAGFLLLTVLPQFPLILFLLLNDGTIIMPLERAVHIVLTLMILIEIIASGITVASMTRRQATKFHLQQFVDLEQLHGHDIPDHFRDPNDPNFGRTTRGRTARA